MRLACLFASLHQHMHQENDPKYNAEDSEPNEDRRSVQEKNEHTAQSYRTATHALHFKPSYQVSFS